MQMKEILAVSIVATIFFGLLVASKHYDRMIARECNMTGGIYLDGICQRPNLGLQ